jgi:hypothetical protein
VYGQATDPGLAAYAETGIWVTRVPSLEEEHIMYPDLPDLLEIPDKHDGTLTIKALYKNMIVSAKDRMIRTDHWKLVYLPMRTGIARRLFDLNADPGCEHDVASHHPDIVEKMGAQLDQWLLKDAATQQWNAHHPFLAPQPGIPSSPSSSPSSSTDPHHTPDTHHARH